jgi:hypothetical protein
LSDFEGTMGRVCEAPHRFRITREPNIRILSFEKFPYSVIFRDVTVAVELLSVPHIGSAQGTGWSGSNNRFERSQAALRAKEGDR